MGSLRATPLTPAALPGPTDRSEDGDVYGAFMGEARENSGVIGLNHN